MLLKGKLQKMKLAVKKPKWNQNSLKSKIIAFLLNIIFIITNCQIISINLNKFVMLQILKSKIGERKFQTYCKSWKIKYNNQNINQQNKNG